MLFIGMEISQDKQHLLDIITHGNAYIITGEAGTGKTVAGGLCGNKLLQSKPKWQKVLYLTYSKLAKWQIIETIKKLKSEGLLSEEISKRIEIQNFHSLWWDIICKNFSFLGIDSFPRLGLSSKIEEYVTGKLDALSKDEILSIIPSIFLRTTEASSKHLACIALMAANLRCPLYISAPWRLIISSLNLSAI